MTDRDTLIVLTEDDCRAWIRDALDLLGCTFNELAEMHRTGDYDTVRHRITWVQIGQWYGVYEPAGDDE
ncbi:hypothetical protein [Nocardia sp. NPDC049707]|uniref:hypothetical protein n=1 Tax=Nocardia sp. NPDC049707 TaxID=3154735 RepID=UPI00341CBF6E